MATAKMAPQSLQPLLDRLDDARKQTDALFEVIRPEALYERPIPERHRLVFYLGHLEAFDWNLIARDALHHPSFHEEYEKLFAFGIDPVDGQLPHDVPSDWPVTDEIRAYNERLRDRIDTALRESPHKLPETIAEGTLLQVAIEHRLMHAETLAYLMHGLRHDQKNAPANYQATTERSEAFQHDVVTIPAGIATLGMRRDSGRFGWDNEFEQNQVSVPKFRIDAYPVTNGEFLEFVNAGSYENTRLWSVADWAWKTSAQISYPHFWENNSEGWQYRGMFENIPLPLDWPVYVSYAEASAYARWKKRSLPTEAQWHRAAYSTPESECAYPWGDVEPSAERGNFDFARWDPAPVNAHPAGQSAFGVHDLLGNGWEWTSTPFAPFPGFTSFAFYPGYSANFFDGKHFVMKGGSPRTTVCMLRRSFRNWFQPHYPYVYAKFRTAEE
ncbi:MAG TPA: SUMF1/EgtB/PvdO family nonheme iron enzyme [Candidatus Acidoferrales bacterium]|nr:SUMF1/EgtB/PvdO family nonheme iron enzyme [Candidatus Acidoferrales bacterium]